MTPRPRRSALYLPASNAKAMAKARGLAADVVILDLEDSVAPEAKLAARDAALAGLREGGWGRRERVLRVNALDTPWGADDLAAAATSGADAVLVPKIGSAAQLCAYNAALAAAPASLKLWAMIETCAAVPILDAIAALQATTRLSAFVLGTNDLAKEMHAQLRPGRAPFAAVLSAAVCAARAHGLTVIDGVCNEFRDLEVFRAEAEQGLEFGFDGKSLIHPDQIGLCNAVFSPSPAELEQAAAIAAAFALPENAGKGVISINGKMAELLHLAQAQRLLAIGAAIAAG